MPRHTSIASILPLSRCCMHYGHGRTLGSPCGPQHGLCTVCPCPVAQYNFIWVPGGHVGWDVLLVRRHLKYVSVWFTKFTKFWGEVKNGPSLGISKNKKKLSASFRGASTPDPLTRGSAPGPRWGLRPRPPELQICHYTTAFKWRVPVSFSVQMLHVCSHLENFPTINFPDNLEP